jgi:hypothetical protein
MDYLSAVKLNAPSVAELRMDEAIRPPVAVRSLNEFKLKRTRPNFLARGVLLLGLATVLLHPGFTFAQMFKSKGVTGKVCSTFVQNQTNKTWTKVTPKTILNHTQKSDCKFVSADAQHYTEAEWNEIDGSCPCQSDSGAEKSKSGAKNN